MLIGSSFIYLELLKTASSHTREILTQLDDLQWIEHGKHTTLAELPDGQSWRNKMIIGNVRNPWDWYVSHWAFGCMQRGGLYKRLKNHTLGHFWRSPLLVLGNYARFAKNHRILNRVYGDPHHREHFKEWLHFVLYEPTYDVQHDYYTSGAYNRLGLYSFEYLTIYLHPDRQSDLLGNRLDIHDIDPDIILDHALRAEHLNSDLIALAPLIGVATESMQHVMNETSQNTNASVRTSYSDYYDDESRRWVEKQDRLILRRHDYSFSAAKSF